MSDTPWRGIITPPAPGPYNMGLDYALLESVAGGSAPVVRCYRWAPCAITIGYFQDPEREVDLAAAARDGVAVIRRVTGGGAVFHDCELTYSIALPERASPELRSIAGSYDMICGAVARAISRLGIDASFAPVNDIIVGGRKISGSAQTRRGGAILQHGTVLIDADRARMSAYLRADPEKSRERDAAEPAERVIPLRDLIGDRALAPETYSTLCDAIIGSFAGTFGRAIEPSSPTGPESQRAAALARDLFGDDDWNARRIRPPL